MKVINLGKVVGADGRGIEKIEKTATNGLVDTYTITYTDKTVSMYDVINGKDGKDGENGSGTGGGLTTEQINALDGLFKIATYKENARSKYNAFREAFGLSGGGDVEPEGDNVIKTISSSSISYGVNYLGQNQESRASYLLFDIPAEKGYTYGIEVDTTVDTLQVGGVFYKKTTTELGQGNIILADSWHDIAGYEIELTGASSGWLTFTFRMSENNEAMEEGCIKSVKVIRKGSGDNPEDSADWEVVKILNSDEITYGTHVTGMSQPGRATYNTQDILAEKGYMYKLETTTADGYTMKHSMVVAPVGYGTSTNVLSYEPGWFDTTVPVEIEVTSGQIPSLTNPAYILLVFKNADDSDVATGSIQSATISRKVVS